jgi:hypothetical protein
MKLGMKPSRPVLFIVGALAVFFLAAQRATAQPAPSSKPVIPRVWDEAELAGWATPVAGLNVRPTHISATEYYSVPEYNLRSYPVYMPGREPDGYWEMLQRIGPKPLIEPGVLRTEADWVQAGQRVFEEATTSPLTTIDPQAIANFRSREFLEKQRAFAGCRQKRASLSPLWHAAAAIFCSGLTAAG